MTMTEIKWSREHRRAGAGLKAPAYISRARAAGRRVDKEIKNRESWRRTRAALRDSREAL